MRLVAHSVNFNFVWTLILLLFILIPTDCGRRKGRDKSRQKQKDGLQNRKNPPSNITVSPGQRAVLTCRVENLGTKTVTWRRRFSAHPLTIGLFTFVADSRITVDYNQRMNEWSLIIQNVENQDEGVYECLISTKGARMEPHQVKLTVRKDDYYYYTRRRKAVQVSGSEFVDKGNPIHLICNATGKPDPPRDVEWYKAGTQIFSDADAGVLITKNIKTKMLTSVLVIKRSELRHDGDYVCRSTNRDSGAIRVHVLNVSSSNVKRGTSLHRSNASPQITHSLTLKITSVLATLLHMVLFTADRWR